MKKFLSFLGSFFLVVPITTTIVACAPREETDVLFLLPGNVMSNVSRVNGAYRQIVDEFNRSEEMVDSATKIKVMWEEGDAVQRRMNSNQQLPDLYISYADNVSSFVLDPSLRGNVRNMEQTSTNDLVPSTTFQDQFWSKNFYDEGVIDNELVVLPMNKSFDISIVNLKVFLELVTFINPTWATTIGEGLRSEGLTWNKTQIFTNQDQSLLISEQLKAAVSEVVNAPVKSEAIRQFFKLNDNVLGMADLYHQLYAFRDHESLRRNYLGTNGNPDFIYSLGLESPSNRVFMEYADALDLSLVDLESSTATDFFYKLNELDGPNAHVDLSLDQVNSPIFSKMASYFNQLASWTQPGANSAERWAGSMIPGRVGTPTVAGHYFVEGTMLLTSGTSAGTWDYLPPHYEGVVEDQFNSATDFLVVPTSTGTGHFSNFLQQGAGLTGFRSVGRNARQKEAVTTKFVNYLLEAKNQNRLAIMAGYVPSTKGGLDMYLHYKNGDYDNQTGTWTIDNLPDNANDYEPIIDIASRDHLSETDSLITDFLQNYLMNDDRDDLRIITTRANPVGTVVRNALTAVLRSYIFAQPQTYRFEALLDQTNELWTVRQQILNNSPGRWTISFH